MNDDENDRNSFKNRIGLIMLPENWIRVFVSVFLTTVAAGVCQLYFESIILSGLAAGLAALLTSVFPFKRTPTTDEVIGTLSAVTGIVIFAWTMYSWSSFPLETWHIAFNGMFLREGEVWPWSSVIMWSVVAIAVSAGLVWVAMLCAIAGSFSVALIVLMCVEILRFISRNVK